MATLLALEIWLPARAAFETRSQGPRAAALAGAQSALVDDTWAIQWNPAGLALLTAGELSTEYARPFGLAELDQLAVAVARPLGGCVLAGCFTEFGQSSYYQERQARMALASALPARLSIGVTLSFLALDIRPTYGADWGLGADLGTLWQPRAELRFGASWWNALATPVGSRGQVRAPRPGRCGVAVEIEPGAWLAADVEIEAGQAPRGRLGQEVRVGENLVLRAGLETSLPLGASNLLRSPSQFSVGFGVAVPWMRLDYAFVNHSALGGTHRLGASLRQGVRNRRASAKRVRLLVPDDPIDINRATLEELMRLPGVGPTMAARIVANRNEVGPFRDALDLVRVPGLDETLVRALGPFVCVNLSIREPVPSGAE